MIRFVRITGKLSRIYRISLDQMDLSCCVNAFVPRENWIISKCTTCCSHIVPICSLQVNIFGICLKILISIESIQSHNLHRINSYLVYSRTLFNIGTIFKCRISYNWLFCTKFKRTAIIAQIIMKDCTLIIFIARIECLVYSFCCVVIISTIPTFNLDELILF